MNKLIVENESNAPFAILNLLLENWCKLAEMIEERTTLANNCELEWRIAIVKYPRDTNWTASASVSMGFYARTHSSPSREEEPKMFVPITLVDRITIYTDGKYHWHGVEDLSQRISTAISLGELSGHYYEENAFPRLNRK